MNWLVRGFKSSVGAKFVVAITGLLLIGFLLAHLLGNLQIFLGADALNSYAAKLQELGPLLWVARIGLLAIFVVHVSFALRLNWRNKRARPIAYGVQKPIKSTHASRSMASTGVVVLLFVIYHLMHFTLGVAIRPDFHALTDPSGRHDVYRMVVLGFQQPAIAMFYIVAMLGLGTHLFHGIGSFFQSIGWNGPRYRPLTVWLGRGLALAIVIGNIAMPLAALAGILELPAWHMEGVN